MALKSQFKPLETFSMSSMTDVIFLLLIFFMVTSTIIFPAAIEVNLPESTESTQLKPVTEVYIDSLNNLYLVADRNDSVPPANTPQQVSADELMAALRLIQQQDSLRAVALYADKSIRYEKVVDVLDMAARNGLKMVLSTRASQTVDEVQKRAEAAAADGIAGPTVR
ncbi:MAG TPA: biopolymer transporter ExbD [Porphyromonadaceae bacterium]|nr:biopolymer transporter ExbD [Porphyromonadaceae bacterium]